MTLDSTCLVDIDEHRADAAALRALAQAHADGRAKVAVVAIAAATGERSGATPTNFAEFEEFLERLGLARLDVLLPMAYWGVTFWDGCVWVGEDEVRLERAIHNILYPDVPFNVGDLLPGDEQLRRWRKAKCDVLAFWAHLHAGRDCFVTSDANFHREAKHRFLTTLEGRETRILRPSDALELLVEPAPVRRFAS